MRTDNNRALICMFAIFCVSLMVATSLVCLSENTQNAVSDTENIGVKDGELPDTNARRFWYDDVEYEVISQSEKTCKVVDYKDNGPLPHPRMPVYLNIYASVDDPDTHVEYKVTEIGDWALSTHLKWKQLPARVYINANIERIGASAFSNAHGALGTHTQVVDFALSEEPKLSYIGPAAFENCHFDRFDIPASIKEIGQKAFYKCGNLKEVKIGEGAKDVTIGRDAFYRSGIEKINLESVTSIGYHAFYKCNKLQDVNLSSIRDIGFEAFNLCDGINHVIIGNDLQSTDGNIFSVSFFDKEQKELSKDADSLRGKEFRGEGKHLVLV